MSAIREGKPMQELNNTRSNRRRTGTVEIPGEDEIKTKPPSPQQTAVDAAPAPQSDTFIEQVAEEAGKGNVNHAHHPKLPQIGDKWAGMTLTKHGWAVEHSEE